MWVMTSDLKPPSGYPEAPAGRSGELEADERTDCLITGLASSWLALFRRDVTRSSREVRFSVPGPNPCRVLVTDLRPDSSHARRDGATGGQDLDAGDDSGSVWFKAQAGDWLLHR